MCSDKFLTSPCSFIEKLSQTKVQDLYLTLGVDHDVVGFYVSMDYSLVVRGHESVTHLNCNCECAFQLEWPTINEFTTVQALQVLHNYEMQIVGEGEIVDRTNVWVV